MSGDILVVDDEPAIREAVVGILEDEGYSARQAGNSEQALAEVSRKLPHLILLDIWLEGSRLDGVQILDVVKHHYPDIPIIMFSGHGTIDTAVAAIKKGAYDFIEKPFQSDRLLIAISRAIETSKLKRENDELRRKSPKPVLLGQSQTMVKLRQTIERVGPTNSRVLISGPPGSGKEVAARMLHDTSRRDTGPFVVLNAAALSPERVDVELFGCEPGWLGPDQPGLIGLMERANGGTLVLDEVADMPLETQGKILRALQDRGFVRSGGSHKREADVRIITTTNRDLQAEMAANRFREDLFYRLSVVPIAMPPLADHRPDIPELVNHFMKLQNVQGGLTPRQIDDDAMAVLQTADWPGDVRQLKNTVERMLIMAPDDSAKPITMSALPPELTDSAARQMDPRANGELVSMPLREARENFERAYLQSQLQRFGGNISRTANFVGMERSALHRKLKTLGLHSDEN